VDRDRHTRIEERRSSCGALRVHVTTPDTGPPAPDRQERHVEPAGDIGQRVEEICVPGEEHRSGPPTTYAKVSRARENGWRRPSCSAKTALTSVVPTRWGSPGTASVTSRRPARRSKRPQPRGAIADQATKDIESGLGQLGATFSENPQGHGG
jgi:hypothetical protein